MPAIITCTGDSVTASFSCPARLRMPTNELNTAFTTWSGVALRGLWPGSVISIN